MKPMKRRTSWGNQPVAPPTGERDVVLYVDDDEQNLQVVRQRLADHCDLVEARSDVDCCAQMIRYHEKLTCILMDIQLQGSKLSGIDLVRLIRGRELKEPRPAFAARMPVLPDIPIIFVTAFGPNFTDDELEDAGAHHVMSKPINFVRLTLALTQARLGQLAKGFKRE
jgi:CheY-like chemotaxis protein